MSITRIQNNQITDSTIVAYAKLQAGSLTGNLFAPTVTLNSNVTINGNLFLANSGNTTTINATNTFVNDPMVVFNNGYTGSLTGYDIGMLINRNLTSLASYGSVNTAWVWSEADQAFVAIATTDTGVGISSINNSGWVNTKVGNATVVTNQTVGGTLGVTGTTTMTTATTGGLQALAIGNVTPGTAVFTTATTGGLQAVAIGNVAPGTAQFTTVTASTVNAATIGNIGAKVTGDGGFLSNVIAANIVGTIGTANVSLYDSVTALSNNQTYYLQFSNISTTGNSVTGVNSSLNYNPSTGTLATTTFSGAVTGTTGSFSGALTLTTATTGGLQAVAIGNVTPGTAAFTTETVGGLQAVAIGNVTPGTATFTTETVGGLQAVAIGNVTPGTAVFTTVNTTGNIVANSSIGSLTIYGNAISSNTGKIGLGSISNVQITGGTNGYTIITDGTGNLSFASLLGNSIQLGANAVGQLVSNAVTLTNTTNVTDAIALLNNILGKLTPAAPPNFPGNVATSVGAASTFSITTGTTSAIMTGDVARGSGWTQQNNISGNTYQLAGGTTFSAIRSNVYATSTLAAIKSGAGTIRVWLGGNVLAGTFTLTGSSGTNTNGNLTVTNDTDYNSIVSRVSAGFWQSANISASAASGIQPGWNTVTIEDLGGYTNGNTNSLLWYNDISSTAAGTPTYSNLSITLTTNTVAYSSSIPHFASGSAFRLKGNVANLSGDTYPTGNVNLTSATGAGGAFNAPTTVTYSGLVGPAGYTGTVPLPRYFCNSTYGGTYNGTTYFETPVTTLTSGFGSSANGPTVTVTNSYASASTATGTGAPTGFAPGVTILYKTGTATNIEETSIPVNSVGTGAGNGFRVSSQGSSNNPVYIAGNVSSPIWNSQTTTLQTYDSINIGSGAQGIIAWSQTNFSTGYLPVGPNLSGQATTQYFTMKFIRTAVSKFDIKYSGTIAGLWVALPGGTPNGTDTYAAPTNGWLDVSTAYAGSGIPGTGTGGNGSAGCAVGGNAVLNSLQTNKSVTATFGSLSSTNSTNNEIWVRVAFTSGQSLTALTMETATH
jgi:hypothetical protein